MRLSLRSKLVLIACAILCLAMAANTWVNGRVFAREYSRAVESRALVIGDTLTAQLDRLLNLDIPVDQLIGFDEQLQRAIAGHDFLAYAMVMSPQGEVLFQNDHERRGEVTADPAQLAHVRSSRPSTAVWSNGDEEFHEVFTPVVHRGGHVATVRIGFPSRFVSDKVNRMIAYSAGITLLFGGLGVTALVLSLNAWVLGPLERFIEAGQTVTGERAGVAGRTEAPMDEMGRLGETFNAILVDVQRQRGELLQKNAELEREVAERRRAEEDIKASEAKYQDLYDSAPDMFASVDALTGTIQQCNRTLAASLGYSTDEIVGRHVVDLHDPDCAAEVRSVFAPSGHPGDVRDSELRLRRRDGSVIDVGLKVSLVRDAAGVVVHSRAVWRDITRRKRAEEALRQSEVQLRQASKLAAVGQLAAGVAHEINNPLTVVLGQAEWLVQKGVSPEVGERARKIVGQAKRAARIIRELQSFARPTAPELNAVELTHVVQRVVDLRSDALAVSGIEIRQDVPTQVPPVHGDPGQLEQVVLNLLMNAEQALATGTGKRTITVQLSSRGDHVRLTVADSGPGIPPEILPRIFEPFFTTKPVGQGTGLGLSICYGIVQAHDGAMWAQSEPGQGTRFVVELPALRRAPEPVVVLSPREPDLRPGRVLVVEDEEGVSEVLSELLSSLGQIVTVAAGGEAASADTPG